MAAPRMRHTVAHPLLVSHKPIPRPFLPLSDTVLCSPLGPRPQKVEALKEANLEAWRTNQALEAETGQLRAQIEGAARQAESRQQVRLCPCMSRFCGSIVLPTTSVVSGGERDAQH
jgi:hypothetical protein